MPTATSGGADGAGASASTSVTGAAVTSTPSTPVKVPSAAASYTPATLDPDLRSQINMVLIRDGHVGRIQDYLLHILNADASNWPATVQSHALSLLRSGEYANFPALMERVMDDIRRDTLGAATTNGKSNGNSNGTSASNGTGNGAKTSLALPQTVIDEALRATRESLDMVCEIEE